MAGLLDRPVGLLDEMAAGPPGMLPTRRSPVEDIPEGLRSVLYSAFVKPFVEARRGVSGKMTEDEQKDWAIEQMINWFPGGVGAGAASLKAIVSGIGAKGAVQRAALKAAEGSGAPAVEGMLGQGAKVQVSAPAIREADAPLFDYSRLREVPNVPQFDLERYIPPRGVPEATQELASKKNVARVNEVAGRGAKQGGLGWYNTEPLRGAFVDELGPGAGPAAYQQYMNMVAATSPRSAVGVNARNASYYYTLAQRGEPLPQPIAKGGTMSVDRELPWPFGHILQRFHAQNANNVLSEGGLPVLRNPKPASFAQNLAGNQQPVTIDTHNMRLWTGKMDKMMPKKNEYGFLEDLQQKQAEKLGMSPAQYQASAWIGGGGETGLRSTADPFLKVFEQRVALTADKYGLPKEEALRRFIRGQLPLLSVGGLLAGGYALPGEPRSAADSTAY